MASSTKVAPRFVETTGEQNLRPLCFTHIDANVGPPLDVLRMSAETLED